ncbi:PRTRC system protein C [Pandoraea commovens]|uniref:PRTRC system protein C n=1 Tax=Pandoraea commovens TaxID=2508289 RepID=A0ABY5QIL5_9BURK|nr:PRTRC system protein C [Pandoraea commovens]UVA80444.1 PRTRC system protein C [Pandoraea commovens]
MKTEALHREFRYNSVKLADPAPAFSIQQVRDFYANTYPEIVNADIEGPEMSGSKQVYTFRRAVGTKGCISISTKAARLKTLAEEGDVPEREHAFIGKLNRALNSGQVVAIADRDLRRIHRLYDEHAGVKA